MGWFGIWPHMSSWPGYLPFLCFFVIWITVLLFVLCCITRNTVTQACVKLPFGEKTRLSLVFSGVSGSLLPQRDSYWELSRPWLRRNWGKGTLALTPWSPDWTVTWWRKGLLPLIVARDCLPRCRGTAAEEPRRRQKLQNFNEKYYWTSTFQ